MRVRVRLRVRVRVRVRLRLRVHPNDSGSQASSRHTWPRRDPCPSAASRRPRYREVYGDVRR